VSTKADPRKLGYIGAVPLLVGETQRDSDSWFTPKHYINLVKRTIGEIDLDPFSSAKANEVIGATRFFDEQTDAFQQTWFTQPGSIFMNPPYSRQLINASIDLFIEYWTSDKVSEAIVLVNNATETKWFQRLLEHSHAICLVKKRIAFENKDGKHVSGNTRGQVFLYYGNDIEKFKLHFGECGSVLSLA